MPIAEIKEPVRTCGKCHHSLALCTCDMTIVSDTFPVTLNNTEVLQIDWTSQIHIDREKHRRNIESSKQSIRERDLNRVIERKDDYSMPVHVIDESARPPRRVMVGKFAAIAEVGEVFEHLKKLAAGKALSIELPKSTIDDLKRDKVEDPVKGIVNAIRRKFATEALPFECYKSNDTTFVVMRENPNAQKKSTKKK